MPIKKGRTVQESCIQQLDGQGRACWCLLRLHTQTLAVKHSQRRTMRFYTVAGRALYEADVQGVHGQNPPFRCKAKTTGTHDRHGIDGRVVSIADTPIHGDRTTNLDARSARNALVTPFVVLC